MKKSFAVIACLALVRLAAANEIGDLIRTERNAIAGIWMIDSIEFDGKKQPSDPKGPKLSVVMGSDGTLKVQQGRQTIIEAKTEINPTKAPKAIDISYTSGGRKGQSSLGIYEIDGDTFRICTARAGKERPAAFKSVPGSGCVLTVYKREKAK